MSSREHAETGPTLAGTDLAPTWVAVTALESAVSRAIDLMESLRGHEQELEREKNQLRETMRGLSSGEVDPQDLLTRVRILEKENDELRGRLDSARQAVERLLAKIRFLEEQR
ncbi:MAG: hypothetical protein HY701_05125 [Gemmatimonadetes bacterium]|nr:hypothetical protein [Gemmatimonadota bacterium]